MKLEDKRFVVFGAAVVEVDQIVAVVVAMKNSQAIVILVLENGSKVSIEGESMLMFTTWWEKNMSALTVKVELPPEMLEAAETPVLATPAPTAQPPPATAPTSTTAPIEAPAVTPENIVAEVAAQVAPPPPPTQQPVEPPSLSDIGKV